MLKKIIEFLAGPKPTSEIGLITNPIMINPTDHENLLFAIYRADAIAREIEQRRAEYREQHPEHEKMQAEALMYAHLLIQAGQWNREHMLDLAARLYP
jgi:hypothetical protein